VKPGVDEPRARKSARARLAVMALRDV